MRAGQKYFWPALFALERGRRGTCCIRIFEVLEGVNPKFCVNAEMRCK